MLSDPALSSVGMQAGMELVDAEYPWSAGRKTPPKLETFGGTAGEEQHEGLKLSEICLEIPCWKG